MQSVAVARNAMATRFEILLQGDDPVALRAAGEEALDEIQRIEAQLSLYQPSSEIAHLNARAATEPVRITPGLFRLLEHAKKLSSETEGAFDITVAPLLRSWGFIGGTGHKPDAAELARARECVGMHLVELNEDDFTVRFSRAGVMLDMGAIGKGFAVQKAAELLRDLEISSALVNGGTSSVYALGKPAEQESWKVALQSPRNPTELLATVSLEDESLSVSAVWGKSFVSEETTFGHVLDPRLGEPVQGALFAAVVLPSATEADAFSTALLVLGKQGLSEISACRPGIRSALVPASDSVQTLEIHGRGFEVRNLRVPGQKAD